MNPKSLQEWAAYIDTLEGEPLVSKARAANQVEFVRALEADGLTAQEVMLVFTLFATRLQEDEQVLPSRTSGSYLDYGALAFPAALPG